MIQKISFKNYKIFKEKQTLELRPITVIFGKNNSGKSAVAKLPTLIEGALSLDATEVLAVENDGVFLGAEPRDLVYGKANRVIELEIETVSEKLSTGILITTENNRQTAVIDNWKLGDLSFLSSEEEGVFANEADGDLFRCDFKGLRLESYTKISDKNKQIIADLEALKLSTDFIGPIRAQPLRDYRLSPSSENEKFGPLGENAYSKLIRDALTTDKKLVTRVAEWYRDNFEGWEIKINQDRAPLFQLEIHRDELKQNLLDAGIGMGQVLPVVTRALMTAEEETLIIIEEPETHLHPAAHGNLASLFVDSLSQGNKRYLIETHSLNFLLRLRRLIAEGKLNKDECAFYYVDFSETENFSSLEKIEVDHLGRVSKWPEGIFNETLDETIAIRTAQINNSGNGN